LDALKIAGSKDFDLKMFRYPGIEQQNTGGLSTGGFLVGGYNRRRSQAGTKPDKKVEEHN